MITQRLLPQELHDAVVPSANTAWLPLLPRWQALSCVMVCGVSCSCHAPVTQAVMFVYCWLFVGVLPVCTPLLNVVVVPVVKSCWMILCSLGWQPQAVGPPSVRKIALLPPWQSACSEVVPAGV